MIALSLADALVGSLRALGPPIKESGGPKMSEAARKTQPAELSVAEQGKFALNTGRKLVAAASTLSTDPGLRQDPQSCSAGWMRSMPACPKCAA